MEKFYNKLVELDRYFGSEEFTLRLFGDKMASKYEYQPIVRHPEQDEEEDVNDMSSTKAVKEYYRPPYAKIKLPMNDSETPLFRLLDKKDDDGTTQEIPLNNFSDVTKHVRYMTKHRMIIEVQKLYALKTASRGDKCKYGVTVRLVAVECTNRAEAANNKCILFFDD